MDKIKATFKKYQNPIFIILGLLLIFFVWWLISFIINKPLLPNPIDTFIYLFSVLGFGETYLALLGTLGRMIFSFALSFILGAILGSLAGFYKWIHSLLKPLILILRTLPTAAAVLSLIVLLKPFWTPVIVTALVIFPIVYEAFVSGINNVDDYIVDAIKLDGANHFQSYFGVYLPASKPYIVLAIIQSLGLGMKVSIMAEILAPSENLNSLGRLIHYASQIADIKAILAYSILAIAIIAIIDIGFHYLKKKLKTN